MLNKLLRFLRSHQMVQPGDRVICAVSGGADSMALLWAMYLLRQQLGIQLEAAHFNHHLRGAESDKDAMFVQDFCKGYEIPCVVSEAEVKPGKKGLEAAAREARYAFLGSLSGKVATAHTADDNAETLMLHLIRGTGLKGLGGISPVRGNLIRPMLSVTRQEVESFLEEYSIPFVEDSSNRTDEFLRNRIRHHVMPLLKQENPSLAENLSATALRLRQDEATLERAAEAAQTWDVAKLRALPAAVRSRVLAKLLKGWGVKEPEAEHVGLLQSLVDSNNPSAGASFPQGVTVSRQYGILTKLSDLPVLACHVLQCPGTTEIPELGMQILCTPADDLASDRNCFAVRVEGTLRIRPRQPGDTMRLPGGTKKLKELFIDQKIPAAQRARIPVLADDAGIVGVLGIGPNRERLAEANVQIRWQPSVSPVEY